MNLPVSEPEWWRVVEQSPPLHGRLHFIDHDLADAFARFLVQEGADVVLVEHWHAGDLIGTRRVHAPPPPWCSGGPEVSPSR